MTKKHQKQIIDHIGSGCDLDLLTLNLNQIHLYPSVHQILNLVKFPQVVHKQWCSRGGKMSFPQNIFGECHYSPKSYQDNGEWWFSSIPPNRLAKKFKVYCGPDLLKYCLDWTKFGKLIHKKIIKIVVTRCHILKLKCTKFDFDWGSVPDPVWGAYSASVPLAGFNGPTSKRREERGGRSRGSEVKGRKRKGRLSPVFSVQFVSNHRHFRCNSVC